MSAGQVLLEVHEHMSTDEKSVRSYNISTLRGMSHLANGLENCYGVFKISNMEDGNDKFDIRVMPHAIDGGLSTGFAKCVFIRCALTILKFKIISTT